MKRTGGVPGELEMRESRSQSRKAKTEKETDEVKMFVQVAVGAMSMDLVSSHWR